MNLTCIYFVFLCVFQVFFCTFIGGISLGNAFQSLEDFWNAKGAAGNVFPVIKRVRHMHLFIAISECTLHLYRWLSETDD